MSILFLIATISTVHANTTWVHTSLNAPINSTDACGTRSTGSLLLFSLGKTLEGGGTDLLALETGSKSMKLMKDVLGSARAQMSCVFDGKRSYFAGGEDSTKRKYSNVDIFTPGSGWESNMALGQARSFLATAASPAKGIVVFAGGEIVEGSDGSDSAWVDVMNTTSGKWIYQGAALSKARKKLAGASADPNCNFTNNTESTTSTLQKEKKYTPSTFILP